MMEIVAHSFLDPLTYVYRMVNPNRH